MRGIQRGVHKQEARRAALLSEALAERKARQLEHADWLDRKGLLGGAQGTEAGGGGGGGGGKKSPRGGRRPRVQGSSGGGGGGGGRGGVYHTPCAGNGASEALAARALAAAGPSGAGGSLVQGARSAPAATSYRVAMRQVGPGNRLGGQLARNMRQLPRVHGLKGGQALVTQPARSLHQALDALATGDMEVETTIHATFCSHRLTNPLFLSPLCLLSPLHQPIWLYLGNLSLSAAWPGGPRRGTSASGGASRPWRSSFTPSTTPQVRMTHKPLPPPL